MALPATPRAMPTLAPVDIPGFPAESPLSPNGVADSGLVEIVLDAGDDDVVRVVYGVADGGLVELVLDAGDDDVVRVVYGVKPVALSEAVEAAAPALLDVALVVTVV